jgi:hypothetical protein
MQRSERFIERTEFGVCEMQPDGSKLGQRNDGKKSETGREDPVNDDSAVMVVVE